MSDPFAPASCVLGGPCPSQDCWTGCKRRTDRLRDYVERMARDTTPGVETDEGGRLSYSTATPAADSPTAGTETWGCRCWPYTTQQPPRVPVELVGRTVVASRPIADTDEIAQRVLVEHQRRDIKGCSCDTWGSDHGHLGQSHGQHVLDQLRAAGVELVRR